MEIKSLLVKISADLSELNKAINDSKSKLQEAGRSMQAIGAGLTAAITLPLAGIGTAAIKSAMEAQE